MAELKLLYDSEPWFPAEDAGKCGIRSAPPGTKAFCNSIAEFLTFLLRLA